jgi:DNA-directed RNA polymerase subunit RPC12/RpoP
MNRDAFFESVQRYEAALGRAANWTLVAFFVLLAAPMTLLLLPREHMPPMSAVVLVWIVALVGYWLLHRWLYRRTAVAMGMTCSKCKATLNLHNLGFSNACQDCGAQVFVESNSPMQPTASGGG